MHGTHTPPTAKTDPVPGVSGAKTKEFCCKETLEASTLCALGFLPPCVCLCWALPWQALPSLLIFMYQILPSHAVFSKSICPAPPGRIRISLLTPARFLSLFGTLHFLASGQLVDILGIVVRLEQVHRGGPLLLCFLMWGSAQCWTQTSALSPHTSLPPLPMADITSCSFLPSLIQPQTLS